MQSGTVFGYQALASGPARPHPGRARRAGGRRAERRPTDPDRRPVRRALGPRRGGRGRHRPRPHAQGPGDPVRGGRRRRAASTGRGRDRRPRRPRHGTPRRRLAGRLVGLGVCGSIAAYKAVELVRLLRAEGAEVVVMLTPSAATFVGPLTFEALSGHAVETDVLGLLPDQRIGHIVVADTADAIVVAPATARWLGAMANGIAERHGHRRLPRHLRAGRVRAGDGRRHVDPPGDARQRGPPAARLRLRDRPARHRLARLGPVRHRAPGRPAADRGRGGGRRRRPTGAQPRIPPSGRRGPRRSGTRTSRAVTSWSARAAPPRPSTPSGSSATAAPAGWASRSPRRRSPGAPASRSSPGASRCRSRAPRRVVPAESTAAMRVAVLDAVFAERRGRPGHGRRRRRLPPAARRGHQAHPRRGHDPGAGAHGGHPRRGRRARPGVGPAPGHRGLRGRDRVARPGAREAPPQGRRPPRRQRRRGARLRLRHRHQPRLDPRRRRHPRRPAADDQARGGRAAARPRGRRAGRTRRPVAHWRDHHGEPA